MFLKAKLQAVSKVLREVEDAEDTACRTPWATRERTSLHSHGSKKWCERQQRAQEHSKGTEDGGAHCTGQQKQPPSINKSFVSSSSELCPRSIICRLHDSPSRLSSPQHLYSSRRRLSRGSSLCLWHPLIKLWHLLSMEEKNTGGKKKNPVHSH